MEVITVNPRECTRWPLADRSGFEFGDLHSLAEDIKKNGQIEPILARPSQNKDYKYEVITGSRRWKACLEADIPLIAIIKPLTDARAAIAQIKENQKISLSDYSKGMSYSGLITGNVLTISELSQSLNCSKAKLHNFLSFAKVPGEVWNAVGNMAKVSSRAAVTIYSLSKKGLPYIQALIEIAEEIKNGAGSNTIEKLVHDAITGGYNSDNEERLIILTNGQVIASWKKGGLFFSKNVNVDRDKFNAVLIKFFED